MSAVLAGGPLAFPTSNITELRNGTTAQSLRVYNTYTDASNYERGTLFWNSNVFTIGSEQAGTGTARAIRFRTGGTDRWAIGTGGDLTTVTDNTIDIGGVGANRPRNVHAGTAFVLADGVTAPTASVGYAKIYVDTADGDLKIIFGDGTVKTIVVDT